MRLIKIWNSVCFDCRTERVRLYVYERRRVCVTDAFICVYMCDMTRVYSERYTSHSTPKVCVTDAFIFGTAPENRCIFFFWTQRVCVTDAFVCVIWLVYFPSGTRVTAHLECVWQMHLYVWYNSCVCVGSHVTHIRESWGVMSHICTSEGACHAYTQVWQMWRSHGICVTYLHVKEFKSMCDMTRDSSKWCKRERVNECIVSCVREKESEYIPTSTSRRAYTSHFTHMNASCHV